MSTGRITRVGLLSALALGIFVLEAQIPMLPIPGFKLGLANLVTLTAMRLLGRKEAACVLTVRVLLGSFVTGTVSALLYSIAGGVLAFAVMALSSYRIIRMDQLWVVSVLGALAHMAGQMMIAVFVLGTPAVLAYGPVLMITAVLSGAFNGLCAMLLCKALKKSFEKR